MDRWWLEAVGWVGSAVLVWSLVQTRLHRLRIINLVGSLILMGYNLAIGVWPMVGLNVVLVGINVAHLVRMSQQRHDAAAYEVLEVGGDDEYLRHVLRVHEAEIRRYNPTFVHDPFTGDPSYLVLRGDATVGVVLVRDLGDGRAQLLLDYVTPPYRDLSPGEFVFGPEGPFRSRGFRRVLTPPDMVDPYYERLGFRREGEAYAL
ncbi:YgjV family protein [Intrasporangium sp. DVR]|uniref:YgjV family protein n=1 Tax=Intrasporangium sp. DVR TaxID=3127867 RepID=UPI00313A6ED6